MKRTIDSPRPLTQHQQDLVLRWLLEYALYHVDEMLACEPPEADVLAEGLTRQDIFEQLDAWWAVLCDRELTVMEAQLAAAILREKK